MSDESVSRGRRAFNELSEVNTAFERVKAAIMAELVATSPEKPEKVLKLHLALQNLTAVRIAVQSVIDDGKMAEHAIAQAGLTRG